MSEDHQPIADWISMNLHALEIERAEVRHWQSFVPTVTFWFVAGIVGLAGFFFTRPFDAPRWQSLILGIFTAVSVLVLTACYFKIANWLKDFVEPIHENSLLTVEKELADCARRLGEYNKFVYGRPSERVRQKHLLWLRNFVCALGSSVALVVFVWSTVTFFVATVPTGRTTTTIGVLEDAETSKVSVIFQGQANRIADLARRITAIPGPPLAEPSHAPEPATEPVTNGEPSPPAR